MRLTRSAHFFLSKCGAARCEPRAWLALGLLALSSCGIFRSPSAPPERPAPATWARDAVTFAYLGHASVLIDFQGTMLLTDPRAPAIGLSLGPLTIGPKREVVSALAAEEIPKLDAVLVTHAHMDSLDRPSLARSAPRLS